MRLSVFAFAFVVCLVAMACEEESSGPPPGPPPGHGAPAKAVAPAQPGATPATPGTTPGTSAAAPGTKPAPGTSPAPGAPAPAGTPGVEKRPPAVPTARQLLGPGRRERKSDRVAGDTRDPDEASPLFAGRPVEPSAAYQGMKTDPLAGVSPIERHWGSEESLLAGAKRGRRIIAAPSAGVGATLFGDSKGIEVGHAPEKPDTVGKGKPGDGKRYRLVLYRMDRRTGNVEVFDQTFFSEEAREAALKTRTAQGYRTERPPVEEIEKVRKELEKIKAAQKRGSDECDHKVTWMTGVGKAATLHSQCFKTKEEADRFSAAMRQKRDGGTPPVPGTPAPRQVRPKHLQPPAKAAPPAPTTGPSEAKPDGSIKPVPIQ